MEHCLLTTTLFLTWLRPFSNALLSVEALAATGSRSQRMSVESNLPRHCQVEEAGKCFKNAFMEVQPLIGGKTKAPRDCQNYQTYMYCFESSVACNIHALAEIAAKEYRKMKGIYHPKESFLAMYGALSSKCDNICEGAHDWSCRSRMGPAAQDKDQAIYMELSGQASQLQLNLVSKFNGCLKFEENMRRWMEFRAALCPDLVPCSCKEPRLESALRICGVPCIDLIKKRSIYYYAKGDASRYTQYSTTTATTLIAIILVSHIVIRWFRW